MAVDHAQALFIDVGAMREDEGQDGQDAGAEDAQHAAETSPWREQQLAAAMGAHVVLYTSSESKAADARRMGAAEVVISRDPAAMAAQRNSFDFILNTVAASHDLDPFIALLKRDCTMTLVGAPGMRIRRRASSG